CAEGERREPAPAVGAVPVPGGHAGGWEGAGQGEDDAGAGGDGHRATWPHDHIGHGGGRQREGEPLMLWLIGRRLLQLPLLLLVIYTVTVTLAWWVRGNPLENPEGRRPPPEVEAAMKAQYKLDSFPKFYGSYLWNATGLRWASDRWSGRAGGAAPGQAPPA